MSQSKAHVSCRHCLVTFAISPQLFPASLMTFNLCSSAGVHGVLVLLFLGGGIDEETSLASSACCCPLSLGSPRLVEGIVEDIGGIAAIGVDPGALRFRDGGELACGDGCGGGCCCG